MSFDPLADWKETFHDWLDNFDAVTDEHELLDRLAGCRDRLPSGYCATLGLCPGSTYADAVRLLRSEWWTTE